MDAIKSLRQTTGRKLQRGNVLSLQIFEIVAYLTGLESPPTLQLSIKKFQPIMTSARQQLNHDPQKLEERSFTATLRKRLVDDFKKSMPSALSNLPPPSPKPPEESSHQNTSNSQSSGNTPSHLAVNGTSKSPIVPAEDRRSILKEIENLNGTTHQIADTPSPSDQLLSSLAEHVSTTPEPQLRTKNPKSGFKKPLQSSYDNWEVRIYWNYNASSSDRY
jgi:hypothetical protein